MAYSKGGVLIAGINYRDSEHICCPNVGFDFRYWPPTHRTLAQQAR